MEVRMVLCGGLLLIVVITAVCYWWGKHFPAPYDSTPYHFEDVLYNRYHNEDGSPKDYHVP